MSGGNVGGFVLQRNIKIAVMVTFSRFRANRYNTANVKAETLSRTGSVIDARGNCDAAVGFSGA
jgi:hypothetical protein